VSAGQSRRSSTSRRHALDPLAAIAGGVPTVRPALLAPSLLSMLHTGRPLTE